VKTFLKKAVKHFQVRGSHEAYTMELLKILSPIIVAICSGLAFLAYKHPRGFSKISVVLNILIALVYLLYLCWMLGFQYGFYSSNELKNYQSGLPIGYGHAFLIYVIAAIYLWILTLLPKIISVDEQSTPEKKRILIESGNH
jgi:uncharacterized membrane protein (DUF485 family)